MKRLCLIVFLISASPTLSQAQTQHVSLGVFSGVTTTITLDQGINQDSRYSPRYDVKLAPIGVNFGVDYQGFGFVVTPGVINIGQNFHMVNTVGGHEGTRQINMQYLTLPLALKVHMIDLSFFRVSLIGGAGLGYLMHGEEVVTHNYAKFRFPQEVYPLLPAEYIVEYDGVLAPETKNHSIVSKNDFNSIQMFVSAGFRFDWEITETWCISLDARANYGIRETRSEEYLASAAAFQQAYDFAGKRRDMFAFINVGISRFVEIDKQREAQTKSSRRFTPRKNPFKNRKGKRRN